MEKSESEIKKYFFRYEFQRVRSIAPGSFQDCEGQIVFFNVKITEGYPGCFRFLTYKIFGVIILSCRICYPTTAFFH